MPEMVIDKAKTALVVIDLQKGMAAQPTKPYLAQDVIKKCHEAPKHISEKRYTRVPCACHTNKRDNAQCLKQRVVLEFLSPVSRLV